MGCDSQRAWVPTPELAARWLTLNTFNRPIQRAVVERYAGDMRAGKWQVNGEAIKLGPDDALLDGQHRLQAIVETGLSVLMTVIRGLDEATFSTLDSGRTRKSSDVLGILGEGHRTALAAALRNLWCHRHEKSFATPLSTPMVLELLEREPGLRESVAWVCGRRWEKHLAPPGVLALCHYRFREIDAVRAETFFEQLHSGCGLDKGNPVLTLRRRLFDTSARLEKNEVVALIFKAWNSHVRDEQLTLLRLTRDAQGHVVIPALVGPRRKACA